jgi:membrane associated rhomboid family serine protease
MDSVSRTMDYVLTMAKRAFTEAPFQFITWPLVAMIAGTLLRYLAGRRITWLGIVPRTGRGALAIVTAPFIHDNVGHLLANIPPFVVLGGLVLRRGGHAFVETAVVLALLSGGMLWAMGRQGVHVGMSGVIFGFLGYLLGLAWVTKALGDLLIAGLVLLVYGGMLAGIKPARNGTSWEGHLFGLLAGVAKIWIDYR